MRPTELCICPNTRGAICNPLGVFFFEGEAVGETSLTSAKIEEQATDEQMQQLLHLLVVRRQRL